MTLATYEILCRVFGSIYWCTSIIYHIACVEGGLYTGYYHAIRLHTFLDSLLVVFKQKQRAPACPQALYFLFEVRRARVIKKEKPRGICWPPAQGGRCGGKDFLKRTKRKIKQRLCTGLCSAWILIKKVPSLYRFWIRNLKWIRCLLNSQCFVV